MSFGEVIVIALVAMIVLGPEKIPEVARFCGRAMRKFRELGNTLQNELDQQMKNDQLRDNEQRANSADKNYSDDSTHSQK